MFMHKFKLPAQSECCNNIANALHKLKFHTKEWQADGKNRWMAR